MPVVMTLNWSEFQSKILKEFPEQGKRILKIIDECETKNPYDPDYAEE